ncbi:MAG: carboxypeptidase-like regulatory domain-containing protein [Bacteroidota bacterium]
MKKYLALLILWIGFGTILQGQTQISGIVKDASTGQSINLVNLKADPGKGGTTSDQEGKFKMAVDRLPVTIRFSHIAYEPKTVTINKPPDSPILISMEPRVEFIGEVVVEGGNYIQLLRRENFYVVDYQFDQDKIWIIGFANKSIINPQLILLSLEGRIIARQEAPGRSNLYKDAFGRIHLIDKSSISQVEYFNNQIHIAEKKDFSGWEQNLFDLELVLGNTGIFKWIYNNGLLCEYAAVDFKDTTAVIIHKSYDRELFRGEDFAKSFRHSFIPDIDWPPWGPSDRMGATFDPSDAFTARAKEQTDYRPIKTHIFRYRNNYLIFEDRGCHIWKYDLAFLDPEDLRIPLPVSAKNTDLLQDPVTGKLFLYYRLLNSDYLAGVDPLTGVIQFTRKLENYPSIENVKVYNNRLWFTHQRITGSVMMNLYSTEISKE